MAAIVGYATTIPAISSSDRRKATIFSYVNVPISRPKSSKSHLSTSIPRWGLRFVSSWQGLKHLGNSINQMYGKKGRKGKCTGMVVFASLFGVGAPEALVIGVVALLVFGPKGLAEVARNLGKTLRAFQPTIRELQEVSREFKTSLEREIGLDEIPPSAVNTSKSSPSYVNENQEAKVDPNGASPTQASNAGEELLKAMQEQQTSTAASEEQAQIPAPEEQRQDGGSPLRPPYSSEEILKVTEEQLTAAADAKQKTSHEEQSQDTAEIGASMPVSEKPEIER